MTGWLKIANTVRRAKSGRNLVASPASLPVTESTLEKSVSASTPISKTPASTVTSASTYFFTLALSNIAPHMGMKHMDMIAGPEVSIPIWDSIRPISAKYLEPNVARPR